MSVCIICVRVCGKKKAGGVIYLCSYALVSFIVHICIYFMGGGLILLVFRLCVCVCVYVFDYMVHHRQGVVSEGYSCPLRPTAVS